MNVPQKNKMIREALGVTDIEFKFYRAGSSHWRVKLETGEEFSFAAPNLATESTVLRLTAEKLAKLGRQVHYPKGA